MSLLVSLMHAWWTTVFKHILLIHLKNTIWVSQFAATVYLSCSSTVHSHKNTFAGKRNCIWFMYNFNFFVTDASKSVTISVYFKPPCWYIYVRIHHNSVQYIQKCSSKQGLKTNISLIDSSVSSPLTRSRWFWSPLTFSSENVKTVVVFFWRVGLLPDICIVQSAAGIKVALWNEL